MASSGRGSRRKGAAGEREAAKALTEWTGCQWRRGIRQSRGGGKEGPDVECDAYPELHVEVKRQKRPNAMAALRQAVDDLADGRTVPVAMTRADGGAWVVTLRAEDFWEMAEAARLGRE